MRLLMSLLTTMPLLACTADTVAVDPDKLAASGTGTTRTFAVADFTGVALAGADDVDVQVGAAFAVRAEGPSEQLDQLVLKKTATTLSIGRAPGGAFNTSERVKLFVTMPNIVAARLAGSGDLHINVVTGAEFSGVVAGSGNLAVDTLTTTAAKLDSAGSGNIMAKGTVQSLTMSVAGAGNIDGAGLTASTATVSIAGSGNATATVNGPAVVSSLGSGNVTLGAGAVCTTSKMGSGEVHCG